MNRRGFLKKIVSSSAVAAVLAAAIKKLQPRRFVRAVRRYYPGPLKALQGVDRPGRWAG